MAWKIAKFRILKSSRQRSWMKITLQSIPGYIQRQIEKTEEAGQRLKMT